VQGRQRARSGVEVTQELLFELRKLAAGDDADLELRQQLIQQDSHLLGDRRLAVGQRIVQVESDHTSLHRFIAFPLGGASRVG